MNHIKELLEERGGLMGMLAEVRAKSTLLKQRWREHPIESLSQEIHQSVSKMHHDLDTYDQRLYEIESELNLLGYNEISQMDDRGEEKGDEA
jgi:hypothetical protein